MDGGMDGRNETAGRSILRSTICIQRAGILLMPPPPSLILILFAVYICFGTVYKTEEAAEEKINKMTSGTFQNLFLSFGVYDLLVV